MTVRRRAKDLPAKKAATAKKSAPAPASVAKKAPARKRAPAKKTTVQKTAEAVDKIVSDRAKSNKKRAAIKAELTSTPTTVGKEWNTGDSLGSNVDRLKTAGVTWKGIAEMANQNGVEMPWPDGGKLLRARTQFLKGTEGKVTPTRKKATRRSPAVNPDDDRSYAEQAAERLAMAMERKSVPWDNESTDEELLEMLNGRRITYVSKNSGHESTTKALRNSKHSKIGHGADGPYYDFVSEDGPFMAISLSRIINIS